jgi:hypothetical protein
MGKRHALNFLERTPRAELVAASSPDPVELDWAKTHLEPFGVRLYQNYDDMLKQEGMVAVVIASATAVHAEQTIKAIAADKHVLCEKPLSTNAEVVCSELPSPQPSRKKRGERPQITNQHLARPYSLNPSSTQQPKSHT